MRFFYKTASRRSRDLLIPALPGNEVKTSPNIINIIIVLRLHRPLRALGVSVDLAYSKIESADRVNGAFYRMAGGAQP